MAGFLDALARFFSPAPGFEPPEDRSLTYSQVWGTGAEWSPVNAAAGVTVNSDTAFRSVAVQAAVRLLVNDIGSLPVDTFRSQAQGQKELRRPSWVIEPNPGNPNETWEDHIKQVVFSMLTDGNAFAYVFPSVFDVQGVSVLDPQSVDIKGTSSFAETTYAVRGLDHPLTPAEIIHIPWMVPAGKKRGLNPIEAAKQGLGIALASDEFVGSYFGNGAILSGVIQFPAGVDPTPEQLDALKSDFARKHVGARKSHAVGALTGGAEYKPFDYNNRNAQLLELRDQIVEEVARLFGIPPHMLGSQKPGAVGYASVEQRSIDYVTHAVLPIVNRIEKGYSRLLRGQKTYLRFNLEGLKRGDQAARSTYYQTMTAIKAMKPAEVRALEDLPFDPDNTGYLETPNNNAPTNAPAARDLPEVRGMETTSRNDIALAALRHSELLGVLAMREPQPDIHIAVEPTPINVAPSEVRVTLPDMPAPVVNVLTPDTIRIAAMPKRMTTRRVKRNADKQITETIDLEEDVQGA